MSMLRRTRSRHASLCSWLLASLVLAAGPASAQSIRAWLGPLNSYTQGSFGPGTRYEYCASAGIPIEWELNIENDTDRQQELTFQIDVRAGLNGGNLALDCPVVLLPPGVDPVADVDCDSINHALVVRNIKLPPCERARLRFNTNGTQPLPGEVDICMGGWVTWATGFTPTRTAMLDQVPTQASNTCLHMQTMCGAGQVRDLKLWYTMDDENGPPLLPGDSVLFSCEMDLRYLDLAPPPEVYLRVWDANTSGSDDAIALPPHIDFVEFVAKPLEGLGAIYEFNAGSRMLRVYDPGCPAVACTVALPVRTPARTEIVRWRGRINCLAPNLQDQCAYSRAYINSSWGSTAPVGQDDVRTYDDGGDATCAAATFPDLGRSAKRVEDGDGSGDAQPGELLTFYIDATNATVCPDSNMICECRATGVVVQDTVDTTYLDPASLNPLDGGVRVGPDRIQWTIPAVDASGQAGATRTVRFEARVRASAQAGDRICNSATLNAAELTHTSEGGVSNCPTRPPISVALASCLEVRINPGPSLYAEKSVTPALACYPPGTRITYAITVTNAGGAPATSVSLRDDLDPSLCPPSGGCAVTRISGGGVLSGSSILWPTSASLGIGASRTETFDVTIPPATADGIVIPNSALFAHAAATTPQPSNLVQVPVCAPVLAFAKSADRASYGEGDTVIWTLTLSNTGGAPATGVVVSDVIDTTRIDESTLAWTPATGSWDAVARRYTWPAVGSLAASGSQVLTFTIQGEILSGTAGSRLCNTGQVVWTQGAGPLASNPATGTCSDIGSASCIASGLGTIGPVKAVRRLNNVDFSWPALSSPPLEYHLNSVTAKADIPPAAACPASSGSRRAGCGAGQARDTRPTPDASHAGALTDPFPLLFYRVFAACGATGELEGPG